MAVGVAAWQTIFELTPILLTGGLIPAWGPGVPIIVASQLLMSPLDLITNALGGEGILPAGLDEAFAHFAPISGASVIDQQMGTYPFANQATAANTILIQPAHLSYSMTCPVRGPLSYWTKLAKMTALIEALKLHNYNGGSYTLITPSYIYKNCLMRSMRDTSSGGTKQVQNVWTLDFEKPMLTVEDAGSYEQKLNSILTSIDDGTNPPAATVQGQANAPITSAFNKPPE